ncbi:MAG TPA: ribosome small subunit-dependent GTPase A [Steroidobacteraceae bacterium]|jgi:ribosome biogenesis GTPase|nr:ribosome small subunit-dependent GTPase A [Steroidobacteraceae bacterium]
MNSDRSATDTVFDADVIAAFGRHLRVRDAQGCEHRARPSGRKLTIVCGDRVRCEVDRAHGETLVVEVLPRRTLLARANLRGESEPVVANITQLVVVIAPLPAPDFFIVDRYLCAATAAGLAGTIAVNKSDLGTNNTDPQELAALAQAGYRHLACSARDGAGLDALRGALAGAVSVLVGQSGVGKSSLVAALLPAADVETGELMREEEGRHTTTASRAYGLQSGGTLIDSPGVRDFAPAIDQLEPRTLGFPEVERLSSGCRFQDCRHMQEPGCAVIAAKDSGELSARRYESYRRLRRRYSDLVEARGPGSRRRS